MMRKRSPPKHRHDGTSPLPLGMDWSPPPRVWNGRDTIWPHDHHTGWSYCVTIPSWVILPKSRDLDPIVFYRVQVGVQSPEGITTVRRVLRRFNDFLKLFADVRKWFPKKTIPPAPPKGLFRLKTRTLLEERRRSLEDWMTNLLSDIDISRRAAVASFLELEAAARSSFQCESEQSSRSDPTCKSTVSSLANSSLSIVSGSTSVASDYGSDTAYEASELGTSLRRDNNSEISIEDLALDEDLTSPIEKLMKYGISNIDEGLFMSQTILDQLESLPRHRMHAGHVNNNVSKSAYNNGNSSNASFLANNRSGLFSEPEHGKVTGHARRLSNESLGSDVSSLRGSEISTSGIVPSHSDNGSSDHPGGSEISNTIEVLGNLELQFTGNAQIILPKDQRHKMNKVLLTMQRKLVTAKTDMEDLISRLNQEIAVKDYLATKVKDLEVELETTKQKSKENLEQVLLIEREKVKQMQWDMAELQRKSLEMELKLKSSKEDEKPHEGLRKYSYTVEEKVTLEQELDITRNELEKLQKRHQELDVKSKSDIKVLVKEIKSLRSSQSKLKQELRQSLIEKSEVERLLLEEKGTRQLVDTSRKKLLDECKSLYSGLMECSASFMSEESENFTVDLSSLADALNYLTTSDERTNTLQEQAQLLAQGSQNVAKNIDEVDDDNDKEAMTVDAELRKILAEIFIDNARLRKRVNNGILHAIRTNTMSMKVDTEVPSQNNNVASRSTEMK